MKICSVLLSASLLTGAAFAARAAIQEDFPVAKPGPEHEILKHMAGTWDAVVQFGPDSEKGTSTAKLGMNGLWITSDFEGQMMGMPFFGHNVMGWDPDKEKYVACWVDSMSASFNLSEGTWDEKTKTMTSESLEADPMTGQKMVNVTKVQDADNHVFSMHSGSADEPAMMTITYTRKK